MPESLFVGAAIVLGSGLVMRVLGLPSLLSGMRPYVAPQLAAEFVGDFLIGVGLVMLAGAIVDRTVGVPDVVWPLFGAGILLSIIAMPKLAGWYARHRSASEDV